MLKELAQQAPPRSGIDQQQPARCPDRARAPRHDRHRPRHRDPARPPRRGLDRLVGLFARLDHPVDFESLDDQPSDLIFLLLAPSSAEADSLKALARISRVLRDPGLRQRLRQERDRDAVYRMLTQKPECHAA